MATILIIGAVLVWLGGLIGGFFFVGGSFLIALSIWAGAFFEGALFFAVGKIYEKTVDSINNNSCATATNGSSFESTKPDNASAEKVEPSFPPIDTYAKNYVNSEQAYSAAYKAHYNRKNYQEAYKLYSTIVRDFPDSKEAKYSLQQIENIKNKIDVSSIDVEEN